MNCNNVLKRSISWRKIVVMHSGVPRSSYAMASGDASSSESYDGSTFNKETAISRTISSYVLILISSPKTLRFNSFIYYLISYSFSYLGFSAVIALATETGGALSASYFSSRAISTVSA